MDEGTPHLHIDFVPFTTESKRGLDTRVSLKQALANEGFIGKGKGETEWALWVRSEKEQLAEIMQSHGIVWKPKKQKFEEEHKAELNAYNKAEQILRRLGLSSEIPVDLKRLKDEYKKLEGEAFSLRNRLEEAQSELKTLRNAKRLAEKSMSLEKRQPVVEKLDSAKVDDARGQEKTDRKKKRSWEVEM